MRDELPRQYHENGFLIALAIVGVLAIGFALLFRSAMMPIGSASIGQQFPPVEAAGWINGKAPSAEDLRGQVLVVDAWAYWCGPCRMLTPSLIELHEKYKDRGVTFIGLTSEGSDQEAIQKSVQFLKSEKVSWLNGYGATKILSALQVEGIPQVWVVDRQNHIIFHEVGVQDNEAQSIERAVIKALGSPDE